MRCIAFTFDDGPDATLTPRLLDILDEHHIHATFFVVGSHLDPSDPANAANRDVLRDAHRRGHFIGNHTYHHVVMNHLDDRQLAFEIDRTSQLITDVIGERPGFFRAPYGMIGTARAIRAVAGRLYTLTRWILDPRDWAEHTPEAVLRNFRYQLHIHPQGGILLMHDVHPSTIAAVPLVIEEIERQNRLLHARGEPEFQIITLDQLYHPAHRRRPAPQPHRGSTTSRAASHPS
jgi:peptidoglycan/xylan/chitin deacetylase (PgdA/CDA1 family)